MAKFHIFLLGEDAKLLGYTTEAVLDCVFTYAFLKTHRLTDFKFNINDEMHKEEGNTFLYLLYTQAKIRRITVDTREDINELQKATELILGKDEGWEKGEERMLGFHLLEFTEALEESCLSVLPHILCEYLYDLCKKFNGYYSYVCKVGSVTETNTLLLCEATAAVIEKCFHLLGITPTSSFFPDQTLPKAGELSVIPLPLRLPFSAAERPMDVNDRNPPRNSRFELFSFSNRTTTHFGSDKNGKLFGLISVADKYALVSDGESHFFEPDFAHVPLFNHKWSDPINMTDSGLVYVGNPRFRHSVSFSSSIEIRMELYVAKNENALYQLCNHKIEIDLSDFWAKKADGACGILAVGGEDGSTYMHYILLKDAIDAALEVKFETNTPGREVRGYVLAYYGDDFLVECQCRTLCKYKYMALLFLPNHVLEAGKIQLIKSMMAVPAKGSLLIKAYLEDVKSGDVIMKSSFKFKSQPLGCSSVGTISGEDCRFAQPWMIVNLSRLCLMFFQKSVIVMANWNENQHHMKIFIELNNTQKDQYTTLPHHFHLQSPDHYIWRNKRISQKEIRYTGVGEEEAVQLFYLFVEFEGDTEEDPLVIWIAGGPGCNNFSAFFFLNREEQTLTKSKFNISKDLDKSLHDVINIDQECDELLSSVESELKETKSKLGGQIHELTERVKELEAQLGNTKKRKFVVNSEDELEIPAEDATKGSASLNPLHMLAEATEVAHSSSSKSTTADTPKEQSGAADGNVQFMDIDNDDSSVKMKSQIPFVSSSFVSASAEPAHSSTPKIHDTTPQPADSKLFEATEHAQIPVVDQDLGSDEITKEELLAQERLFAAHEEFQRNQALAEQVQAKINAEVEQFDETDWMNIGAQIASNISLTRDLIGDNATADDIVALLRKKKKEEDAKKLKAKLAKPPTQAELTHTMRVVVKNMSPAVFNSGWSKEKVWNMPHEKLVKTYNYIMSIGQKSSVQQKHEEPPSKKQKSTHETTAEVLHSAESSVLPDKGKAPMTHTGPVTRQRTKKQILEDQLSEEAIKKMLEADKSDFARATEAKVTTGVPMDAAPLVSVPADTPSAVPDLVQTSSAVQDTPEHSVPAEAPTVVTTEASADVPADTSVPVSTPVKPEPDTTDASSTATRRKTQGRKRPPTSLVTPLDASEYIEVEEDDGEDPIPHVPLVSWEVHPVQYKDQDINVIHRADGSVKYFSFLSEILTFVDREDLLKLYSWVTSYYKNKQPTGSGMYLKGDLTVLFDSNFHLSRGFDVWMGQSRWEVSNWKFYPLPNVHVLSTVAGKVLYMCAEITYPISLRILNQMLEMKLLVPYDVCGNDMTHAEQLITAIRSSIQFKMGMKAQHGVTIDASLGCDLCPLKSWLVQRPMSIWLMVKAVEIHIGYQFTKDISFKNWLVLSKRLQCTIVFKLKHLATPVVMAIGKETSNPLFSVIHLSQMFIHLDVMRIVKFKIRGGLLGILLSENSTDGYC
ncbi:Aminoacyl-tRNA synthetase, class 1a, anticodon-binding [Artemisia annua]|uniref:arginine--tRNA ligase n=1 Tax=Artemisia annua TaxID=35608 RepID=A0A2U1LGR3_ARTAN|nr:Aminoacyl-tRNA synthetase, class 1a, anticodon-binding [Artemisia annua]